MDIVSDRWYAIFTRAVTAFSFVLLIASLADMTIPAVADYGDRFGLSYITLVLAAVLLLFRLLIYPVIVRHNNLMVASLMMAFVFMTNLVNLVHSTGKLHSWYQLAWAVLVFMSGIFGVLTVIGFCFLTTLYLLVITTEVPGNPKFEMLNFVSGAVIYLVGLLSFIIWRRSYKSNESVQVAKLSGQLKTKEQQAEILIQSITDALFVITQDGKISLMNPAATKMVEWGMDEGIGIDAHAVIKLAHEDGKELTAEQDPFTAALTNQKPLNQTLQLTTRSGKKIIASLAVSPVVLPNSTAPSGAVAVLRDISAARAEEQKRADFISTASHEMRTPIAAIEGYLALALNDKVSNIDSKARSYLEKAHSSTQGLGKLFQDLLTSAKAEDGRLVSHPVVVEMGAYLEQLADSLRFSAEKKGLLMDFILGSEKDAQAEGVGGVKVIRPLFYTHVDPDRLREVITNIFDNAVKYTDTGKVSIGLTGNNDVVQVFIRDTGPGIPAEDIPHLFQKFYRVDNSATRTVGGTGLGLFISRKIVELYNGRVWVESEVGKGSTFYMNLPRLSAARASELQAVEAAQASGMALPPS